MGKIGERLNILIYFIILVAKMVEVTIGTTRIVLITRGERLVGAILGFVEVIMWVVLVSTVLIDVQNDPFKVVMYALGFALGNYVGSVFEQRLGIGNVRVEAIVMDEHGTELTTQLRNKGYAVTVLEGKGMHFDRQVLLLNIPRKNYSEVVDTIKTCQQNVVITINDIKPVYGGHGILKR